jgi:hypothetical protein
MLCCTGFVVGNERNCLWSYCRTSSCDAWIHKKINRQAQLYSQIIYSQIIYFVYVYIFFIYVTLWWRLYEKVETWSLFWTIQYVVPTCLLVWSCLYLTNCVSQANGLNVTQQKLYLIFLGAFAKLRKVTISFVTSLRLDVHIKQLGCYWTEFHEIYIIFFSENLSRKFKFFKNRTRIKATLCDDRYTFFCVISRSFLLTMRNV